MDRPYFLCFDGYYLSAYGISAVREDGQWISLDISKYDGDAAGFLKNVPFDKIGAFVFEPGSANGMVKLPPKDLVCAIEAKIKEAGGIIIANEVTTGMGRTGKWFGHRHYGMRPDVVAIGKGIGNGYPVSVAAFSKPIADLVEKSDFKYAQSHQDDPLGCAVAKEVIACIESNGYIQNSAKMGTVLGHELVRLQQKHSCIKEVRGIGLMYVMEFFDGQGIALEKIHKELFDRGYIVGVSPVAGLLRFYPPLTIDEEQIKAMGNCLDAVLSMLKTEEG